MPPERLPIDAEQARDPLLAPSDGKQSLGVCELLGAERSRPSERPPCPLGYAQARLVRTDSNAVTDSVTAPEPVTVTATATATVSATATAA